MTREVKQTEGQRMLEELKRAGNRKVEIDDIIAIEVLSGVGHVPIAHALKQIVDRDQNGFMGIETVSTKEQLARMLYQLEIGDVIDSNPTSLNSTNLYRIRNILTASEVRNLLESPDENKAHSTQSTLPDDYVLVKDLGYDELSLFPWNGSHFDGIWGLPNYSHNLKCADYENDGVDSVYFPKVGDVVPVTDENKDIHFVEVRNQISGPTLVKRLF